MTINVVPNEVDRLNGVLSVVGGDPRRARELRANIAVFARRLGDPEMTRMVNEVLGGRRNVREIFRTPQFREVAARNMENLERGLEQQPPGVVERLLADAHERAEHESDDEAEAETASAESRLHALRDRDLAVSPVGASGDVEPDEEPRRGVRRF